MEQTDVATITYGLLLMKQVALCYQVSLNIYNIIVPLFQHLRHVNRLSTTINISTKRQWVPSSKSIWVQFYVVIIGAI